MTLVPVRSLADWRARRRNPDTVQRPVGFVPTMGALHAGHAALISRCVAENATTVVSIFINPAQFNDPSDLAAYPRTPDADLDLLETLGVQYALLPEEGELYPDGYRFRLTETEVSRRLCGAHRPGHFDGVLTVVLKLLNVVRPDAAYFGEKDYQQYRLVRDMTTALFLDVDIRPCPIVRESGGLALSSRNVRLSAQGRTQAEEFAHILHAAPDVQTVRTWLEDRGIETEYVEEWDGRRLAAVIIDGVRLIDNVPG